MAVIAGDLGEIAWKNPSVGTGSGTWYGKAGADMTIMKGGLQANDAADGVDSGGRALFELTNTRWSMSGTITWDMVVARELNDVQLLSASGVDTEFTISNRATGQVYSGVGRPVGEISGNAKSGTIAIKLGGGGILKEI